MGVGSRQGIGSGAQRTLKAEAVFSTFTRSLPGLYFLASKMSTTLTVICATD